MRLALGASYRQASAPLSTLFLDFDWADEVLHVHLARRVLAYAFGTTQERVEAGERAAAGYGRLAEQDRALERSDWWSEFYAGVQRG